MAGAGIFSLLGSDSSAEQNSARLGRISLKGRKPIETPDFLAITSRGVVPHLTPDVVREHTQFHGVHFALEDYLEKVSTGGTAPIINCPSLSSTPLHTFTALPSTATTLLAPRRVPAVSAPNGSTDDAISIFTSVGFQSLSAKAYVEYIQKLRPDIAVSLGDVPYGALPGTKRIAKMGDRTLNWLELILSTLGKSSTTDPDSESSLSSSVIFAPILPIDFHAQREYLHYLADDAAGSISGLAIYSSSLLPDIPATTALSSLPRLSLDEPSSPHQILRQISLGMDLFVVPFIGAATDGGLALTFQFPRADPNMPDINPTDDSGRERGEEESLTVSSRTKPLAVDLSPTTHATSLAPLLPSCVCYTCTTHQRAFVHHLLSAKEMLGWVLLQIHNHHVVSRFFAAVRASIARETFEDDQTVFENTYEAELPAGMGQRPRARGYHFKSEGPGEKRRNKPAWSVLGGGERDAGRGREGNGEDRDEMVESSPDDDSLELEQKGFAEIADVEK